MARKVKQNKNTTIEGGLQAALKLAGLVPATSVTVVTDVDENTAAPQPAPAIEEIHDKFVSEMQKADDELGRFDESTKEMDAAVTTAASAVTPAVAVEVQEALLPKPVPASTTTSEWVIKAAAQLRFKSLKAHRPMSWKDIFKSRESRASEDALLLAQAEEEIRLELAAR